MVTDIQVVASMSEIFPGVRRLVPWNAPNYIILEMWLLREVKPIAMRKSILYTIFSYAEQLTQNMEVWEAAIDFKRCSTVFS